jgi:hypothetical protein
MNKKTLIIIISIIIIIAIILVALFVPLTKQDKCLASLKSSIGYPFGLEHVDNCYEECCAGSNQERAQCFSVCQSMD